MEVLYEDNHIIVVNKAVGEIVQGDKTGDVPLCETVREWIRCKYQKPGNVYLGVVHRLDRPVSGVVLFAKTSKALPRLNRMFAAQVTADGVNEKPVRKTYWAVTADRPEQSEGRLTHWLTRNEKSNTVRAYDHEVPGSKMAVLDYRVIGRCERYFLMEINLLTGRHHQIRCQLAKIGCPIKGDLKYGARRSNPDGGICLHARELVLVHPVSHKEIRVVADVPEGSMFTKFDMTRII